MRRDDRTFVMIHDGLPDHPKVIGLSDAGFRMYVAAICWCSRHLTDGLLPDAAVKSLGTVRAKAELSGAGLLVQDGGGWAVHDYLEHQRSAEQVAELKEKRRLAGSKGGKAKANARASGVANGKQSPSKVVADTEEVLRTSQTDTYEPNGSSADLAVIPEIDTTHEIVAEWMRRCTKRPPEAVIGQTSKSIRVMLGEGIDADDIRRGIAQWMTKGLHPSVLPSVVNEVMNTRPATKSRDQQATDDMFDRAAQRMGVTA